MKKRKDIRIICITGDIFEVKHDSYDEARIEELGLYIIKELYIVKYFPLRNISHWEIFYKLNLLK